MSKHVAFFGADDGTRTRTAVGHQHLKLASLPIPAHPQICFLSLFIIGENIAVVKKEFSRFRPLSANDPDLQNQRLCRSWLSLRESWRGASRGGEGFVIALSAPN